MPASVAARVGWESLRHAMRSWNINSEDDLSAWLGRSGFPATRPGNHIHGRAQEHIVTVGCQVDARVALLECVFVALTLDEGRQRPPHNTSRSHHGARTRDTGISFRSPPHQLGRHRRSESGRGILVPNTNVEKLPRISARTFPPQSMHCSSGKDAEPNWLGTQWRKRGLGRCSVLSRPCCFTDLEVAEEWARRSLLNGPTCLAENSGEQDIIREQKRRGRAACSRVQQGQVSSSPTGACGSHSGSENPRYSR